MKIDHVTIIGVGALGSHVAQFLRSENVKLRLIDFDRVEQKNALSQFHGKNGIGKNKASALHGLMLFLWGEHPEVVPHALDDINVDALFDGTQLVIDCVDNGKARRVMQKWARSFRLNGKPTVFPMLHGGLAADGAFGRAIWDEQFVIDDEPAERAATCEDGAHLPFIALTAATIARAAQIYIKTGQKRGFSVTPTGVIPT